MGIYLVVFFLAVLCCFLPKKFSKIGGVLVMLLAFFVCAFRARYVGTDTPHYLGIYDSPFNFIKKTSAAEYVFCYLVELFYDWGFTPFTEQVIFAVITYVPIILLFVKESRAMAFSVLIFIVSTELYFFESLNLVRQMASLPYILWAYIFLQKREWLMSALFAFIAVGFHTINLVSIPFMLLAAKFELKYSVVTWALLISLAFAFVVSNIGFLQRVAMSLENFAMMSRFTMYANYEMSHAKTFTGLATAIIPPTLLCLASYKQLMAENKKVIAQLFFYGCFIFNMLSLFPTSQRMAMNLIALEFLIYPFLIDNKGNGRKYAVGALIVLSIYFLFALSRRSVVPYSSVLL